MSNLLVSHQEKAISTANEVNFLVGKAFAKVLECGEHLIAIKESLPHGEFIPWVETNMPITIRNCNRYMQVNSNQKFLPNKTSMSHLSLTSALEIIKKEKAKLLPPPKAKSAAPSAKVKPKIKSESVSLSTEDIEKLNLNSHKYTENEVESISIEKALEILGITGDNIHVTPVVIKIIYKGLSSMYHPDKPTGDKDKMAKLNQAYGVLK